MKENLDLDYKRRDSNILLTTSTIFTLLTAFFELQPNEELKSFALPSTVIAGLNIWLALCANHEYYKELQK